MKCIDTEKIKEKIQSHYENAKKRARYAAETGTSSDCIRWDEAKSTYAFILYLIDSLQQEQIDIDALKREWYDKGYLEGRKNAHIPARELGLPKCYDFQQEQPEPYFYCKYGGTIPVCSDCKRNHNNSSFKTEEITTWYAPSNGTKQCIDYIQQEQSGVNLEKELYKYFKGWRINYYSETEELLKNNGCTVDIDDVKNVGRHFYELGRNARKED